MDGQAVAAGLKRKRALFSYIGRLANDSYEAVSDSGREASEAAMKNRVARKRPRLCSPARKESQPLVSGSRALDSSISCSKGNGEQALNRSTIQTESRGVESIAACTKQLSTKKVNGVTGAQAVTELLQLGWSKTRKRKSRDQRPEIPEERQIFKGLHFFFFPNLTTNTARRIRIAKAIEYGAVWQPEWNDEITHVIVDKGINYAEMLRFLHKDELPSKIVVVNEDYPADCIGNRYMLNPCEFLFKVKGYAPKAVSSDTVVEVESLKLKLPGKDVIARQPQTPSLARNATASTSHHSCGAENRTVSLTANQAHVPVESTVEFDNAIERAKVLAGLSLESDEDGYSSPTPNHSVLSSVEQIDEISETDLPNPRKGKKLRKQDRFQCMQKHDGDVSSSPNANTIDILQQMAEHYMQMGDGWRSRAYRNAIATLRRHPLKVSTKQEALALPRIGERLAEKIEEIVVSSTLRRLDNIKAEPGDHALRTFMKIYGVGFSQASRWVNAGYKTLDQLLAEAELNRNQRIGIERFEDFNTRIPRAEVEQHGNIVQSALHAIDPEFEVIIGGSYRRGATTSGDVDCLITTRRPGFDLSHIRRVVLEKLIPQLQEKGFITAELAVSSRNNGSKWMGASTLPAKPGERSIWRRIDFFFAPADELGAALIYWTGNDIFNRSMRLLASSKGMRLNQRGLYRDVMRGKGRVKLTEGTLVEARDEKRIFELLGVPWRPPCHRIC